MHVQNYYRLKSKCLVACIPFSSFIPSLGVVEASGRDPLKGYKKIYCVFSELSGMAFDLNVNRKYYCNLSVCRLSLTPDVGKQTRYHVVNTSECASFSSFNSVP